MKDLHQKIADLVPQLFGWSEVERVQRMASLVIATNASVSVEIGTFGGRSFLGLAAAHAWLAHGTAHAIDPWSNEAAIEGYDGANKQFWNGTPLNEVYASFMHHMKVAEVLHRVIVHRKKSDDVDPPKDIDVLSIDGQHTEQAVTDVKRFASNVRIGGFCLLDDEGWQNGNDKPVQRAVKELTGLGFIRLYTLGTGGVYQRVK